MSSSLFNNNWTPAHILYYVTLFVSVVVGTLVIISTINLFQYLSDGRINVELPVHLEAPKEDSTINISDTNISITDVEQLTAEINLTGSDNGVEGAIIGFHLFNISKFALYFFILFLFGKIFKSVKGEEPFHKKNSKRLYSIGVILILYRYFFWGYDFFFVAPFFEQLRFAQDITVTHLDYYQDSLVFTGIFIIVLGYVFKEGARLYEEQKLTV
jgi:hypothetical protein